jgi:hypothetical protein
MYHINLEFAVGEEVYDDLTSNAREGKLSKAKVIGVHYSNGASLDPKEKSTSYHCVGYRVDNDYLDGLRHPWEITALNDLSEPEDEEEIEDDGDFADEYIEWDTK